MYVKKIGITIKDYLMRQGEKFPFLPWYLSALDIIESKLFKMPVNATKRKPPDSVIPVYFHNKGIDFINLPKIINRVDVKSAFPSFLSNIKPTVVYKLSPTIRKKIFNYKQFVNDLNNKSFTKDNSIFPCDCENSLFVNIYLFIYLKNLYF